MITVESISDAINRYNNIFDSNAIFLSYMRDLYPEDELSVVLLYDALCLGIVDEIRKVKEVSNILQNRYVNLLCSRYGISKENAEWSIYMWTCVFGKNVSLDEDEKIEEILTENHTNYPYDIIFNDDIDGVISDFQFDTLIEPDNIKLKYHFVSYLSFLATRPQDDMDKEMYVLKLMDDAIDKIIIRDNAIEDMVRECLLEFTKGYSLFLQGNIANAIKYFCLSCEKIELLNNGKNIYINSLDELYTACIFDIYTALKCCNINAQKFFDDNSEIVHKCIEESYVCQNENCDNTLYYFYTMSSPENEFFNVKTEVRNNIYYSLPDLDIGYIKIKNRNNKIIIDWDHYGYKLSYSLNISGEMLKDVNDIAKEYKFI